MVKQQMRTPLSSGHRAGKYVLFANKLALGCDVCHLLTSIVCTEQLYMNAADSFKNAHCAYAHARMLHTEDIEHTSRTHV